MGTIPNPRYRLNVDFDNSLVPFLYNEDGEYTFTVPNEPNFMSTRYVVFLPAVIILSDPLKIPAISGYIRIEGSVPGAYEFRTVEAANYDTALLKNAIEFHSSAAGETLTLTNFWTVGSTVDPDIQSQIEAELRPPALEWKATAELATSWGTPSGIAENEETGVLMAICQGSVTGKLIRSTDRGVTWSRVTLLTDDPAWVNLKYYNGAWYAVAFQSHPSNTAIARSTDDGLTWSWCTTPTPTGCTATAQYWFELVWTGTYLVCICNQTCTDGKRVMQSTDGITWTLVSSPGLPAGTTYRYKRAFYFEEDGVIIVNLHHISTSQLYRLAVSFDHGATWTCLCNVVATANGTTQTFKVYDPERWICVGTNADKFWHACRLSSEEPVWDSFNTYAADVRPNLSGDYGDMTRIKEWTMLVGTYGTPSANLLLTRDGYRWFLTKYCREMLTNLSTLAIVQTYRLWKSKDRIWIVGTGSVIGRYYVFYAEIPEAYRD